MARKLNTGGNAYHSPFMKPVGPYYQSELERHMVQLQDRPTAPRFTKSKMISSVTNKWLGPQETDNSYWRKNLELPVLFDQALQTLLDDVPVDSIIEIGPHKALSGPIRQVLSVKGLHIEKVTYHFTLVREQDDVDNVVRLAGSLFVANYDISLEAVNGNNHSSQSSSSSVLQKLPIVDLPPYQWHYEQDLWKESRWSREFRFRTHRRHDLLGSKEPGGLLNAPLWRNRLMLGEVP